MFSDTSPEAERVLIDLLRQASVEQRLARTMSITENVIEMSRRAIAKANPHLTPLEVKLTWVELNYGKQLGDAVRRYLKERA